VVIAKVVPKKCKHAGATPSWSSQLIRPERRSGLRLGYPVPGERNIPPVAIWLIAEESDLNRLAKAYSISAPTIISLPVDRERSDWRVPAPRYVQEAPRDVCKKLSAAVFLSRD